MKFMSGLEGYIDQLEMETKEERRAKKLRDRQRIETVSSDNDCDDWEDCSEDSDDTAFEKYYRKYVVNKDADETTSDDDGGDSDDSEQAKKNLDDYLRFMANCQAPSQIPNPQGPAPTQSNPIQIPNPRTGADTKILWEDMR